MTRNPVPDHAHSDDEETSKNRKNKKNKHPVKSSTQSSSHPVALVTDTRRTNPQSPSHVVVESWEEEETEDEFVDAPEFPEAAKGPVSEKPPGKNGTTQDPSTGGGDASSKRNSSRVPVKSQKGGPEEGGGKGARKSQRAAQSNNIGQVDPSGGGETKGSNKRTPRTRSPPEDPAGGGVGQYKGRTSSVTKWSNRSDSPLNSSSRLVSSTTGTRGAYVACVDQEEEESCESWTAQVEPGSDWSNDDKSDAGGRGLVVMVIILHVY